MGIPIYSLSAALDICIICKSWQLKGWSGIEKPRVCIYQSLICNSFCSTYQNKICIVKEFNLMCHQQHSFASQSPSHAFSKKFQSLFLLWLAGRKSHRNSCKPNDCLPRLHNYLWFKRFQCTQFVQSSSQNNFKECEICCKKSRKQELWIKHIHWKAGFLCEHWQHWRRHSASRYLLLDTKL